MGIPSTPVDLFADMASISLDMSDSATGANSNTGYSPEKLKSSSIRDGGMSFAKL